MPKPTFVEPHILRKNACDPALCATCGHELLPGGGAVCVWCRAQPRKGCAKENQERVAKESPANRTVALGTPPRTCLCGRRVRWAYVYCWWCREAMLAEDAAAQHAGPNGLPNHDRLTFAVDDYGQRRIEALPRTPRGALIECASDDHDVRALRKRNMRLRDYRIGDGWF